MLRESQFRTELIGKIAMMEQSLRNGKQSVNQLRKKIGLEEINSPISNSRFVVKKD